MNKKGKSSGMYRLSVQFDTTDEDQRFAINFLSICGYRKNQIIALMAKEFAEIYNLDIEKMSMEDVKSFIDSYPYIQNFKNSRQVIPVLIGSDGQAILSVEKSAEKKDFEENTIEVPEENNPKVTVIDEVASNEFKMDMSKADKALSAFGL